MVHPREFQRQTLKKTTTLSMSIVTFDKLERVDVSARALNISMGGMGIVVDHPLEPGFVRFWDKVGKHKTGVLVWCKRMEDNAYRAGIQFIPLDAVADAHAEGEADLRAYPSSLRDPGLLTSILVDKPPFSGGKGRKEDLE